MLSNKLTEHHRQGIYRVGDLMFINKSDALIVASKTNQDVTWHFNDTVFSSIDWSIPIETSLQELYKIRAQQLRDKYDYLSLFFSGGVDSANVLHSFIDNDIFLDEIVMYRPAKLVSKANTQDKTTSNIYSEIEFAAIPHLQKHLKNSKTKVRFIDMDESTEQFFNNPSLLSQFYTINKMTTLGIAKIAMCTTDPIWNNLYNSGKKVAHIQGVDKPIINFENGEYIFQFGDAAMSFNFESSENTTENEMLLNHQYHEFFYWTPDLPELVVKQCQVVKSLCKNDMIFKFLFINSYNSPQDRFMAIINYIYPPHVNEIRNTFTTVKPGEGLNAGQGKWFYDLLSPETVGKFNDLVRFSQNSIDDRFFRSNKNIYIEDTNGLSISEKTTGRFFKSKKYIL